jgi:serine/threonine protein kinase
MSPILQLDPDGTFQRRANKTQEEVIESLQFLAAELTLGLWFLHDCGIVHQDIKPANVMVTPLGHVQISDFGAASLLPILLPGPDFSDMGSPTRPSEHLQEFGSLVIGPDDVITFTPRYAAPELLQHNEDGLIIYDERVDWWGLGLTLSELAYGDIDTDLNSQPKAGVTSKLNQFLSQVSVKKSICNDFSELIAT